MSEYTLRQIVEAIVVVLIVMAYLGYGFLYPGAPLPTGWYEAFFLVLGWLLKDVASSIVAPIARALGF
jgi:hypothetical protein